MNKILWKVHPTKEWYHDKELTSTTSIDLMDKYHWKKNKEKTDIALTEINSLIKTKTILFTTKQIIESESFLYSRAALKFDSSYLYALTINKFPITIQVVPTDLEKGL